MKYIMILTTVCICASSANAICSGKSMRLRDHGFMPWMLTLIFVTKKDGRIKLGCPKQMKSYSEMVEGRSHIKCKSFFSKKYTAEIDIDVKENKIISAFATVTERVKKGVILVGTKSYSISCTN